MKHGTTFLTFSVEACLRYYESVHLYIYLVSLSEERLIAQVEESATSLTVVLQQKNL